MIAVTKTSQEKVEERYVARRLELLDEAARAEISRRPIAARRKREAAAAVERARKDEHDDEQPSGLERQHGGERG